MVDTLARMFIVVFFVAYCLVFVALILGANLARLTRVPGHKFRNPSKLLSRLRRLRFRHFLHGPRGAH